MKKKKDFNLIFACLFVGFIMIFGILISPAYLLLWLLDMNELIYLFVLIISLLITFASWKGFVKVLTTNK